MVYIEQEREALIPLKQSKRVNPEFPFLSGLVARLLAYIAFLKVALLPYPSFRQGFFAPIFRCVTSGKSLRNLSRVLLRPFSPLSFIPIVVGAHLKQLCRGNCLQLPKAK